MTIQELANDWRKAGVEEGDTLLLHSSLKRTLKRYLKNKKPISPEMILDSFLYALGPSGTLLLPLFNFDFTRGVAFDIRNTPSQMGVLTEIGRARPDAVRTGHPIYSFAVLGAKSDLFKDVNNFSGYGEDSPFAMLVKLAGKIAVLNLPDQNSMTFYHHVEEMLSVDYRYHKKFTGEYIDISGNSEIRTYGLFVRDLERGVKTNVDPMGELLWKDGLYSGVRYDSEYGLRVVSAEKLFAYVAEIIGSGRAKGLLYSIEEG